MVTASLPPSEVELEAAKWQMGGIWTEATWFLLIWGCGGIAPQKEINVEICALWAAEDNLSVLSRKSGQLPEGQSSVSQLYYQL